MRRKILSVCLVLCLLLSVTAVTFAGNSTVSEDESFWLGNPMQRITSGGYFTFLIADNIDSTHSSDYKYVTPRNDGATVTLDAEVLKWNVNTGIWESYNLSTAKIKLSLIPIAAGTTKSATYNVRDLPKTFSLDVLEGKKYKIKVEFTNNPDYTLYKLSGDGTISGVSFSN